MKIKTFAKNTGIFLIAAASLVYFISCNNKCSEFKSSISGQTVKTLDLGECFLFANVDSSKTITTEQEWNDFKTAKFKNCNTGQIQTVDFNQHSLLAKFTKTIGCNAGMERNLSIDNSNKLYTYTIKIKKCTGCNTQITSSNWIVVPKIPDGYTVKFLVEE